MGSAAAAFGDDGSDLGEDVAEGGAGDPGDENIAGADAGEFAFAIDDDGSASAPADAGGVTFENGAIGPNSIWNCGFLHVKRASLQELEACFVHGPFDFDGQLHQVFGGAQKFA